MALPQQCRTLADDDYIDEALRLQQGGRVNMILIACVVPLGLQAQPGHRGHLTLMAALHVPVQGASPSHVCVVLFVHLHQLLHWGPHEQALSSSPPCRHGILTHAQDGGPMLPPSNCFRNHYNHPCGPQLLLLHGRPRPKMRHAA